VRHLRGWRARPAGRLAHARGGVLAEQHAARLADEPPDARARGKLPAGQLSFLGGRRRRARGSSAGPPRHDGQAGASRAALTSLSASAFWARGTERIDQRSKPARACLVLAWSGLM